MIVGLNSDDSIKRIKGSSRPIKKIKSRLAVLESIKYIDLVITFNEDTPIELIKNIKPDILVKGGDYKEDEIIGRICQRNKSPAINRKFFYNFIN